ncbi:MAG: 3-isopropylmalate dehydrogenase [Gammaproteobacteria bacterium]|nr:3-isopropylmalate dehydrogenase [Gammaproteobacteria bacterium]MYD75402.1 3-isopropylmalate dehydrogenase [Gammaproteobacteria bacterium]MYJ51634.1 3-isopropylmalate dehydrogenase [Gammaproteobacteria bacterium]
MNEYRLCVMPGDGIGPEIMKEGIKALKVVEARNDVRFHLMEAAFGAAAWFETGSCCPDETWAMCDRADAIIKGTVGLSLEESRKIPVDEQPERSALLPMRRRYDTFANFRPVYLPRAFNHFSPLKPEVVGDGIDIMIIRELVGGIYFGEKETGINDEGLRYAREVLDYDERLIKRTVDVAFETATKRRRKLHNINKSNVLKSSILWTDIVMETARDFPDVEVHHMLVDAAATALCLNPGQFDVMVMENMFGDILSDQAGGILGSLGLMPSACLGPEKAYYEPSHGSAPDIAGKNVANPYSMIGSFAMMLDMSFGMREEADNLWKAMESVFAAGYSTGDLSRPGGGIRIVGTEEFGDRVADALDRTGDS